MGLFRPDRGRSESLQGAVRAYQYFRRPGSARSAQDLFEMADLPAALRQWRIGRWLRHHLGDVQERRAEAVAGGGRRRSRLDTLLRVKRIHLDLQRPHAPQTPRPGIESPI